MSQLSPTPRITLKKQCPLFKSRTSSLSPWVLLNSKPNKLSKTKKRNKKGINNSLSFKDSMINKNKKKLWLSLSWRFKKSSRQQKKPRRMKMPRKFQDQFLIINPHLWYNQPSDQYWFNMRKLPQLWSWQMPVSRKRPKLKTSTQIWARMIKNKLQKTLRKNTRTRFYHKRPHRNLMLIRKKIEKLQRFLPVRKMKKKSRLKLLKLMLKQRE